METSRAFVPALGFHGLTGAYDTVVALATRERRWRAELLRLVAPNDSDRIVDVGCGTGTFARMLAETGSRAEIHGIDPDENVLRIARAKHAPASVAFHRGFGDALTATLEGRTMTKVVSSLVLHQCAMPMKRAILQSMFDALVPGGQLFIADYGAQRTLLMRMLFRPVQLLDGIALTQPNADGRLPELIADAGFANVREAFVLDTPTGSISLLRAERP